MPVWSCLVLRPFAPVHFSRPGTAMLKAAWPPCLGIARGDSATGLATHPQVI
jgi:hypothetical protein